MFTAGPSRARLSCNLMEQIGSFLYNELNFEIGKSKRQFPIYAHAVERVESDDFYYTYLEPTPRLLEWEEGTWVKIEQMGNSQYGSIWFTEQQVPYLLTGDPISLGTVSMVEADGIQLLNMQSEAFLRIYKQNTAQARIIKRIMMGEYSPEKLSPQNIEFFDERISRNNSQALAVKKALTACRNRTFFLIHGPPGTGKTTVITEIVRHLIKSNCKVLITSHTNIAVDNVMENLLKYYKSDMVRFGPKVKVSKPLKELVPTTHDELIKLKVARIVGATLSKLSVLVLNSKLSFDVPYFDSVIIDESSMATIPLTLCGLMLAKTFVLVGDHMQLPPITRTPLPPSCTLSEKCGFCESMFRLLIEQYPQKSQLLDLQFRSHPLIMGFSAQFIYRGKIRSSEECYNKKLQLRNLLHEKVKGIINE